MSKSHTTPSVQSTEKQTPAPEPHLHMAPQSNASELADSGLESQGADASEMGMAGSFADMVLDCLPFVAAIPLAKKFSDNPVVVEWAKSHTLEEVVDSIRGTANSLLKEVWPVGVGLFAQGRAAGQIVGGVDAVMSTEVTRTSTDMLSMNVAGEGLVGLSSGVAGLELHDRFGDVGGAMAKANLKVGTGFDAQTTTEFDVVEMLSAAGHLSKDLNGVLTGGIELFQDVTAFAGANVDVPDFLNPEWSVDQKVFVQAAAVARAGALAPEHVEILSQTSGFTSSLVEQLNVLMPLAGLAAAGRLTLTESSEGHMVLEGNVTAEAAAMLPTVFPELGSVFSPEIVAALSDRMAASSASSIRLVLSTNGLEEMPSVMLDESGLTFACTGDVSGAEITDSAFVSLSALAEGVDTMGGPEGVALIGDLTRTVRIDLDPAEAEAHCPQLIRQLVGVSEALLPSKTSLQLVGKATLKSDVIKGLVQANESLGQLAIMGLSEQAIDWAAGARSSSTHAAFLEAAASEVEFSDARVVGTVCTGQGGGVDAAAMGVKGKAVLHAQEGFVIDKPVSQEDACRIREVLRGGHRAV